MMDKTQPFDASQSQDLTPAVNVVKKWAREIIWFVLLSMVIAFAITFFLPKKYYSQAIILPTNPLLTDKARMYNKNIDQLYSIYGTGDDLDRLYALANTDAMYTFLVDSFKLISGKQPATAKRKMINKLRKNIELTKSSNGELLIGVWSRKPELSAQIANAVIEGIKKSNQQAILEMNKPAISYLEKKIHETRSDTLGLLKSDTTSYGENLQEIMFSVAATPPPFVIIDKATPAVKATRPRTLLILVSVFLSSLFFAIIASNILERYKKRKPGKQTDFA